MSAPARRAWPILGALAVMSGCGSGGGAPPPPPPAPPPPPPPSAPAGTRTIRLTDVTSESGIDMIMTSGGTPSREILEVNGGGLGLIDFDGDGDRDLFVANGATLEDPEHGPGCRLYRNLGDLRFEDATAAARIDLRRWAMGVAVGDVDGDGHDDLYVTCFGPNVLLRNDGAGGFEDVTAAAGVGDGRWGTSAAFADLDGDGDLDLYVVNYVVFDPSHPPPRAKHKGTSVMAGPHGLPAEHDVVYENRGDGTFRDVTDAWGFRPERPAYGLNVTILDFDGDGLVDVLAGNDSMANHLFHNRGPGATPRFEEIGMVTGIASNMDGSNQATMGIAIADVDDNGRPDVFTTNFSNDTNTLHLNLDGRYFDDRTRQFGLGLVSRPYLGWACAFRDLDHDGDEDLLIFNGHVYPEATPAKMDSAYEQPPLLFARDGARFALREPETAGAWLGVAGRDRTAVFSDLDGDGDVDVVFGGVNEPVRVLRNEAAGGRPDWLVVELRDARAGIGNRHGIGAVVEIEQSGVAQRRWITAGGGFQSSDAPDAHFGLGAGSGPVAVTVTWPDGTTTRRDVEAGGRIVIAR